MISDASLISAHLAGDKTALATLLARYRKEAEALCIRYRADLEDVMQSCALRVLELMPSLGSPHTRFGHLMVKLAQGFAVRQRRWYVKKDLPCNAWTPSQCEDFERPDIRLERAQTRMTVQRTANRLQRDKPKDEMVMRLRYWEESSIGLIAEQTGQSKDMVVKRLGRALDFTYRDLGNDGPRPKMRSWHQGHDAKRFAREASDG